MESFFLAETTKYLYLLFDPNNFLHNNGSHGDLVHTPNGDCIVDAGGYVFNTEAHPIDLAAVHCCSTQKKQEEDILQNFHDNLNLLELLDIVHDKESRIIGKKLKKKRAKAETKEGSDPKEQNGTDHNAGGEVSGGTDIPETNAVQEPAGPSGKQGEEHQDTMPSESSTAPDKGKETTATSPQANIKTTIIKTQFPSADKLPPQDTSSLNSDSQPSGSLPTASSTVGIQDNGEKVFTEAGHQKQAFDLAQQILDLFSSVTKQQDTDVEGRLPTVADLYAAVANYSIAYISNPSLMRCPAQPFHSRLSVWGEMFEVDDIPAE